MNEVVNARVKLLLWSSRISLTRVDRVDPADLFGRLDGRDLQVHDDWLLAAAHHDTLQRRVAAGVDLLVRDIGRHEDEVARLGLGDIFQLRAPPHPCPPLEDIDVALQLAMMMSAGLRVRMDGDRAGP